MPHPPKHIVFWALLLILGSGTPARLHAQEHAAPPPEAALRFEHLDSRAGLSHNTVFSIHQDHYGYLWIGTTDGLNRYDGYTFTVYRHNSNDSTSLSNNTVRWVQEDGHGNLWVATRSGLDRFDWETERFSRSGLRWDTLTQAIAGAIRDRQAPFWVNVNDQLFRFDDQTDTFHPTFTLPTTAASDTSREAPAPTDRIWSLFRDRSGTLWLGTVQGLLYAYRPETEHWEQFASPWKSVRIRIEDAEGRLWLSYESPDVDQQGTGLFDPEAGTFTPFSIDDEASVMLQLKDREGFLWFSMRDGLYRYTPATKGYQFVPCGGAAVAFL